MAQDTPSRKLDQYIVRFPDGMREELKSMAFNSNRSLNAEIVHRLKDSLEASDPAIISFKLPDETLNALSIDAAIRNVNWDERASQILQAVYDESSEFTASLLKVEKLAREGAALEERVRQLTDIEDADFLLYFSKVTQFNHFLNLLKASLIPLPEHIQQAANDFLLQCKIEMETLKKRHEKAMHYKNIEDDAYARLDELDEEISLANKEE